MIEPRVKKCHHCQSENIIVCRIKGNASAVGIMNRETAVFIEVCVDCGQVVNMIAEHPKKLRGEK